MRMTFTFVKWRDFDILVQYITKDGPFIYSDVTYEINVKSIHLNVFYLLLSSLISSLV